MSWVCGLGCQCPCGLRRQLLSLQEPWSQGLAWSVRAGVQSPGSPDMSMHSSSPVSVMRRSQTCACKDRGISEKRTQQVQRPWDGDQAWWAWGTHSPRAEEQLSRGSLWKMRPERQARPDCSVPWKDEDRSLDFILIIWETTKGFYRWYEIYVTKIILATVQPRYVMSVEAEGPVKGNLGCLHERQGADVPRFRCRASGWGIKERGVLQDLLRELEAIKESGIK